MSHSLQITRGIFGHGEIAQMHTIHGSNQGRR